MEWVNDDHIGGRRIRWLGSIGGLGSPYNEGRKQRVLGGRRRRIRYGELNDGISSVLAAADIASRSQTRNVGLQKESVDFSVTPSRNSIDGIN